MNNENGKQQSPKRQEIRKEIQESKKRKNRKPIRLIPIWLRVLVVLAIFAASLLTGAMFGYGVIGEGDSKDILTKGPWQKVHDIIYKDTD